MILKIMMLTFSVLTMLCMYKIEFYGNKKYYVAAVVNFSISICLYLADLYKEVI